VIRTNGYVEEVKTIPSVAYLKFVKYLENEIPSDRLSMQSIQYKDRLVIASRETGEDTAPTIFNVYQNEMLQTSFTIDGGRHLVGVTDNLIVVHDLEDYGEDSYDYLEIFDMSGTSLFRLVQIAPTSAVEFEGYLFVLSRAGIVYKFDIASFEIIDTLDISVPNPYYKSSLNVVKGGVIGIIPAYGDDSYGDDSEDSIRYIKFNKDLHILQDNSLVGSSAEVGNSHTSNYLPVSVTTGDISVITIYDSDLNKVVSIPQNDNYRGFICNDSYLVLIDGTTLKLYNIKGKFLKDLDLGEDIYDDSLVFISNTEFIVRLVASPTLMKFQTIDASLVYID